jgi:predicted nucleic acid-binding protein
MAPNKILPDTCAWIDFFKGNQTPLAESLEKSLLQREVLTCGVVICELLQESKSRSKNCWCRMPCRRCLVWK